MQHALERDLVGCEGVEGDVSADEERPIAGPNLVAPPAALGLCGALTQAGVEFVEVAISLRLAPDLEAEEPDVAKVLLRRAR